MDTRRDFLRKAALLTGATGIAGLLPDTIRRAMAIDPAPGSTFLDAEHVVFLMQENRSFDHALGTLRGVRGFSDPRALRLEDGRPVFLQRNKEGDTYAPFRLNIRDTKATWMSALPHSWSDQVDARNGGKYDRWLDFKRSGNREYGKMPLTMGYYDREDIPFYYALADAFTVCDQHFCSSLTGTTPNRLYFWTGTIRAEMKPEAKANVWNSDVDYGRWASWRTFPEVLEANDVSWKIYQNEISADTGLEGEEDSWLANFTDNPIEWFSQYHVQYSEPHLRQQARLKASLPLKIAELEKKIAALTAGSKELADAQRGLQRAKDSLAYAEQTLEMVEKTPFSALPEREQRLHRKAFTTNSGDPDYHSLTTLRYDDNGQQREMQLPKGDVLHQFRQDVEKGQLPTVSWIVAPENFSDHPGAPWYGAWYLSEVMDILTQNPEVWKKTIFVLTYDENDGYFDHVPPFLPPVPGKPETGKVSPGIDPAVEYVTKAAQAPGDRARECAIGLGYRVPMIIASPWTRGGYVNSQVLDHTSNLQFLEHFLSAKLKKQIASDNITAWRRAICGDLTSAFRPYNGEKIPFPESVDKVKFVEMVHNARFKEAPANFEKLAGNAIRRWQPRQEKGTRPACALPYQLTADVSLDTGARSLQLMFGAGNQQFKNKSAGAPFIVYSGHNQQHRNYAVKAGDTVKDEWTVSGDYQLDVYGPNGFYRQWAGAPNDPALEVKAIAVGGDIELLLHNRSSAAVTAQVTDESYGGAAQSATIAPGARKNVRFRLGGTKGWHDLAVRIKGNGHYLRRYAGRVETGAESISDPLIGRS
ncbi:phosphocholine-specific phospholipase C [Chitinophaga lutea]